MPLPDSPADRVQGQFWLAAAPDLVVPGVLTFGSGAPFLELAGALTTDPGIHLIHGAWAQTEATLLDAIGVSLQGGIDSFYAQGIRVGALVAGAHLQAADCRFARWSARFTHLDDWVNAHGFETAHEGGRTVVRFEPWPGARQVLPGVGSLELRQMHGWRMPTVRGAQIHSSMYLDITVLEPVGLSNIWDDYLSPLEDLLSTCTGVRNHVTELRVYA